MKYLKSFIAFFLTLMVLIGQLTGLCITFMFARDYPFVIFLLIGLALSTVFVIENMDTICDVFINIIDKLCED